MSHALRQFLVLAVVVAIGLGLWRWVAQADEPPPAPPRVQGPVAVEAVVVAPQALRRRFEVFGNLEPSRRLPIASELGGRLEEVHPAWGPGGLVAEGERLFQLDERPFVLAAEARRAEVADAEARLAVARTEETRAREALARLDERRGIAVREHERVANLVEGGVVSQSVVDQALSTRIAAEWEDEQGRIGLRAATVQVTGATAGVEAARAALELAEDQLQRASVHAPFAGAFVERAPQPGTLVVPGQTLGELVGMDRLLLEARVPADELLHLSVGLPVDVTLAGRPEVAPTAVLRGTLRALAPRVDPATRHGRIEIEVTNPSVQAAEGAGTPRLPAGLFARATVELEAREELWIARRHFAWRSGRPTAFVVEDGQARARELVFAREHEEGFVVATGLRTGDRLILAPLERLVDGTPVEEAPAQDVAARDSATNAGAKKQ